MEKEYEILLRYFEEVLGYCPDEKYWLPTRATIGYLLDNNFSAGKILNELAKYKTISIHPNDLSEELWKGSLLKKNHFYFHKEFQITSPPPILVNGKEIYNGTYLEMKIRYDNNDVLTYFYNRIPKQERYLCEPKTDTKAIAYILNRLEPIEDIEPVDVLMCIIDDYIKKDEYTGNGLISVLNSLKDVLPIYQYDYRNAKASGHNVIRWRYEV